MLKGSKMSQNTKPSASIVLLRNLALHGLYTLATSVMSHWMYELIYTQSVQRPLPR